MFVGKYFPDFSAFVWILNKSFYENILYAFVPFSGNYLTYFAFRKIKYFLMKKKSN